MYLVWKPSVLKSKLILPTYIYKEKILKFVFYNIKFFKKINLKCLIRVKKNIQLKNIDFFLKTKFVLIQY